MRTRLAAGLVLLLTLAACSDGAIKPPRAVRAGVDASAPRSVPFGKDVRIDVRVRGIGIVAANGDTSGQTGHFHYFVDRDPVAAGQVIPKEDGIVHAVDHVFLKGLAAGPHKVWVVLGDGTHRALSPLVADLVTFDVTQAPAASPPMSGNNGGVVIVDQSGSVTNSGQLPSDQGGTIPTSGG